MLESEGPNANVPLNNKDDEYELVLNGTSNVIILEPLGNNVETEIKQTENKSIKIETQVIDTKGDNDKIPMNELVLGTDKMNTPPCDKPLTDPSWEDWVQQYEIDEDAEIETNIILPADVQIINNITNENFEYSIEMDGETPPPIEIEESDDDMDTSEPSPAHFKQSVDTNINLSTVQN